MTLKKLAYNLAEKRNGAGNLAFEELEDVIARPCEEDVWELTERYCETDVDWEETKLTYLVDSDGTIHHGIVRYCFYAPSLEVIVNYSCGQVWAAGC